MVCFVEPEALGGAQRAQQLGLAAHQARQVLADERQAAKDVLQQLGLAVQACSRQTRRLEA
jgi:hypothetical protein